MDNMSTTLIHKYHTLKAKKSTKRLASQDIFPSSSPSPSSPASPAITATGAPSYSSFINDLVSAFNSLSTPSASSTTSPTLHTSFQGADHEALVDTRQKKKVVKALQLANPAQVNEIIALLKAMPDPSKLTAAVVQESGMKKSHSRDSSQQSLLSFVQDKSLKKKDDTVKKQKTDRTKEQDKKTRLEEDEKLGDDWDKVEKKWSWETQKSNDQLTGVVDPESCKNATETILATAGSWFFSSSSPDLSRPPHNVVVPEKQKTLKSKPSKISTSATNNDATNAKTTGFASLWTTTTPTPTKPPVDPSSHNKKTAHPTTKRTASAISLSTGEQIAQAAATLLATAAIASPKELPNAGPKQIRHQSSMPNIKTATLKRLLPTTKAGSTTTTTSDSSTTTKTKASTKTDSTALTPAPSYISTTLSSLTKQWLIPCSQTTPPPTNMMSAYTYWWGYEIYVPHKCMDTIEQVSNTSQIFFGFLSGTVGAIPGLAALVPIAKIISAWVGYQWGVIKTQDAGRGVVISATWVLPVALASRPWDHCGHENDSSLDLSSLISSPKKTLKSKLRLTGS
ncbi:hypothetical protein BGW39_009796 [Mortierella sp. 14UC]|nr:hypothetical protein BGW39_009796 [Mortierella sp. 14UC]